MNFELCRRTANLRAISDIVAVSTANIRAATITMKTRAEHIPSQPILAGIEAGGTSFRCAVATKPTQIVDQVSFATTQPQETVQRVQEFFSRFPGLKHLGLATFGPVDLDTGRITDTPKNSWQHFPIQSSLERLLGLPCALHTDVAAAALAEATYGSAAGALVYITVGTGIGGAAIGGHLDLAHTRPTEMGHLYVPRAIGDDFAGICPYHGDCVEGLASGPALAARWHQPPEELAADHPAWTMQTHYLSHLCLAAMRTLAPEHIILGGGVMQAPQLIERVRRHIQTLLGDYHDQKITVSLPSLTPDSGLIGALELAYRAAAVSHTAGIRPS